MTDYHIGLIDGWFSGGTIGLAVGGLLSTLILMRSVRAVWRQRDELRQMLSDELQQRRER